MERKLLYGSESPCCHSPSLIVKSREGGFVTQNCTACGKPRAISFAELPPLGCSRCGHRLEAFRDAYSNYCYRCPACRLEFQLAEVIPHWAEYFEEFGFALRGEKEP